MTIWLQTNLKSQPRTPTRSAERFPEQLLLNAVFRYIHAVVNIQVRKRRLCPIFDFVSPPVQILQRNTSKLPSAFDTKEKTALRWPFWYFFHIGKHLCIGLPPKLRMAVKSFPPPSAPEWSHATEQGGASLGKLCCHRAREILAPTADSLLAQSLVHFEEVDDNLPQHVKKAEKINYKND